MIDTFNYKLKWEPACYKDNQQKAATDHLSKTIKSSITLQQSTDHLLVIIFPPRTSLSIDHWLI